MKKTRGFLLCTLLFSAVLLRLPPVRSEAAARKLTLMIYMCGSNLESSGGSATEDIAEMRAAMPDGQDVSVLVLTGGSDVPEGTGYFGQTDAGIYELAGGGRIRRAEPLNGRNMGDGATLSFFLRWGLENRPAERYALILWNHGGGPLEGVCWDETADMDHLTMGELTGALQEAMTQKLDWIGFDACLMSSLEVAGELAPYADYMIASQEMEPSFGWNYSFLRDLPGDTDGAETGRRIVDAFFAGQEDSKEILTLACIDLGAAGEAIEALDPVFLPLSKGLNEDSFPELSARRMATSGFGKAEPGFTSTGYDLVDARDLAESLEASEETKALIEKLDAAVVYSRANEEGASGLTLYYPYANKTNYLDRWKTGYEGLSFSPGYQAYVSGFGSLLTGESLFRWLNLLPDAPVANEDGSYAFSMQLTSEQAENTVSAQVIILRDVWSSRLSEGCVRIAACNAEIGPDGRIRASWDGRCLYAEKEDGSLSGPVVFSETDDGMSRVVTVVYSRDPQNALADTHPVAMILDAADTAEYPEIVRVMVWDEATESMSSRLRFSEEGYVRLLLWNRGYQYPGAGETNTLPDLQDWELSAGYNIPFLGLPQEWRLRYVAEDSGDQYYAVFRLLDSQQRAVCSVPVEVPNPFRRTAAPVSGGVDTPEVKLDLSCTVDTSPDGKGLHLEWTLENRLDEKATFRIVQPVLNGHRITGLLRDTAKPFATIHPDQALNLYDTAYLNTLDSVSGTLEILSDSGDVLSETPFSFAFDSLDLSGLQPGSPLAETEQGGITLRLFRAEPDIRTGLDFSVLIENSSGADFTPEGCSIHGAFFNVSGTSETVSPGMSRAMVLNVDNDVSSIFLRMEKDSAYELTYLEDWVLQSAGIREIRELGLWAWNGGDTETCFPVTLQETIPLAEPEPIRKTGVYYPIWNPPETLELPRAGSLPEVARHADFVLRLRRVIVGYERFSLSLEISNLSDEWIWPNVTGCRVNGKTPVFSWQPGGRIPPGMTVYRELTLDLPAGETELRTLELTVSDGKGDSPPYEAAGVLTASRPVPAGQEGGSWVNGDFFTAETGVIPERPEEEPEEKSVLFQDLMNRALEVPADEADYSISLDAGIPPEETGEIDFCKVCVVRKNPEGTLGVLTIQDVDVNADGKVLIEHPGWFVTAAGQSGVDAVTYLLSMGRTEVKAKFITTVYAFGADYSSVGITDIRWTLDRENGTAEIASFSCDPEAPDPQMTVASVQLLPFVVCPETDSSGTLLHIADMEQDFMAFLNAPYITLDGRPLQFELRPVTKEDDLYFLVSVAKKDGTRYSLPLIPFPLP